MKRGLFFSLLVVLILGLFAVACSDSGSGDDDDDDDTTTDGDNDLTDDDDDISDDDDDNGGVIIPDTDGDTTDDDDDDREGCMYDTDCPGNQYCYFASDTSNGRCVDRKQECDPCTTNRECLYDYDYCLPEAYGSVCGSDCSNGLTCPTNYVCTIIPELDNSKQCVFDTSLLQGTQGTPCCTHEDCDLPLSCRRGTAGKTCQNGCTANADCPMGMICNQPEPNRTGECIDGCTSIDDCPGGTICVDGQCMEGECTESAHCAISHYCDTVTNECVEGCQTNDDCPGTDECQDGTCVVYTGCKGTYECSLGDICTKEMTEEEIAQDDPSLRGECYTPTEPYCDPCTDTQNQNNECGDGNFCVELTDPDTEQSLGHFCLVMRDCFYRDGEGGTNPGDEQCPRGYSCIFPDNENMPDKYCIADCTDENFQ